MIWAGRLVCASDGGSCEGSADERAVGAHITMGFSVRSWWAASGHTVPGAQKMAGLGFDGGGPRPLRRDRGTTALPGLVLRERD